MSEKPTPRLGHAPIVMRRVDNVDSVGDFMWKTIASVRHIKMALPAPTPGAPNNYIINLLPVERGNEAVPKDKGWTWDGNEDKPTLYPSVHCIGYWHGWIRNGEMVET